MCDGCLQPALVDTKPARESESQVSKRKRRKFEPEFEEEAVRLVLKQGQSVSSVAKNLDIYPSSLGDWVKHTEAARKKGGPDTMNTSDPGAARARHAF